MGDSLQALVPTNCEENPAHFAHLFGLTPAPQPLSPIAGIHPIDAGALVELMPDRIRVLSRADRAPIPGCADLPIDEIRRHLLKTTRSRARPGQNAIMLSGGVDSSVVAWALSTLDKETSAVTWNLPQWPQCNESEWAAATARHLGLRHHIVTVEDRLPGDDLESHLSLEYPIANAFWPVIKPLYERSLELGKTRVFNGHGGDALVAAHHWLLTDHWRSKQYREAVIRTGQRLSRRWDFWNDPEIRTLVRSTLGIRPRHSIPDWTTRACGNYLSTLPRGSSYRADHIKSNDSSDAHAGRWAEQAFARRHGISRHHPLQGADLVRCALGTRSNDLIGPEGKIIWQRILGDELPAELLHAPRRGILSPLFYAGVFERHRDAVNDSLRQQNPFWSPWVKPKAVLRILDDPAAARSSERLLIWLCWSAQCWAERFLSR